MEGMPPEHSDSWAWLSWRVAHSERLGVDSARIALMGDSGGGGLAAAAVLLACEQNAAVARQLLVYPMLDNRNTTPDPAIAPFASWSYDNNFTEWHALSETPSAPRGSPSSLLRPVHGICRPYHPHTWRSGSWTSSGTKHCVWASNCRRGYVSRTACAPGSSARVRPHRRRCGRGEAGAPTACGFYAASERTDCYHQA
jgi:acetyl esterase/lipase